ncbi:MAG: sulfurtransferase TusA family protein [gamma proteobacterium symbiont of Bathyaustriella thionipta]|nr:sulfurtransferase TusA family protein [gamma proteobacterium symbiont of Bathyaustriella thionipta]
MSHEIVDARRLLCPMPVIRVQNRIAELPAGTLVKAICSDPGALSDIPAWCRINGHQVLETRVDDDEYIVIVQVGENT